MKTWCQIGFIQIVCGCKKPKPLKQQVTVSWIGKDRKVHIREEVYPVMNCGKCGGIVIKDSKRKSKSQELEEKK